MSTKTTKKEFNLNQAFTLWINKGKKGGKYLSGRNSAGFHVRGFFNNEKQNPKEPDIRIYTVLSDGTTAKEECCSLWCNVSEKTEKKYLSGKFGNDRVIGFFNSKAKIGENIPYINVYYSEDQQETAEDEQEAEEQPKQTKSTKKTQKKVEPEFEEVTDDDLPF